MATKPDEAIGSAVAEHESNPQEKELQQGPELSGPEEEPKPQQLLKKKSVCPILDPPKVSFVEEEPLEMSLETEEEFDILLSKEADTPSKVVYL